MVSGLLLSLVLALAGAQDAEVRDPLRRPDRPEGVRWDGQPRRGEIPAKPRPLAPSPSGDEGEALGKERSGEPSQERPEAEEDIAVEDGDEPSRKARESPREIERALWAELDGLEARLWGVSARVRALLVDLAAERDPELREETTGPHYPFREDLPDSAPRGLREAPPRSRARGEPGTGAPSGMPAGPETSRRAQGRNASLSPPGADDALPGQQWLDERDGKRYESLLLQEAEIVDEWKDLDVKVELQSLGKEAGGEMGPGREHEIQSIRDSLRSSLRDVLSRMLDLRERERARKVERLREEIGVLEKALKDRRAPDRRKRIVDKRLRDLLGEP